MATARIYGSVAEAKARGYDVKVLKKLIALRKRGEKTTRDRLAGELLDRHAATPSIHSGASASAWRRAIRSRWTTRARLRRAFRTSCR